MGVLLCTCFRGAAEGTRGKRNQPYSALLMIQGRRRTGLKLCGFTAIVQLDIQRCVCVLLCAGKDGYNFFLGKDATKSYVTGFDHLTEHGCEDTCENVWTMESSKILHQAGQGLLGVLCTLCSARGTARSPLGWIGDRWVKMRSRVNYSSSSRRRG
eukprot:1145823-Pelagomonas_calceolata.AAC.17